MIITLQIELERDNPWVVGGVDGNGGPWGEVFTGFKMSTGIDAIAKVADT